MECELANRAESLIGGDRGGCDTVARKGTLMKMNRTDQLREQHQRRAHDRNRARQASASLVEQ